MSSIEKESFIYETERLCVRGLRPADLDGPYLNWFNDQEVCRYNSHGIFPSTREKLRQYLETLQTSETDLVWAIIEKESRLHIGNISLQAINLINRSAELALIMGDKTRWGRGYALEASRLIIEHGVKKLGLRRIYCGTSENNQGMIKLAGRLGMEQEGVRRAAIYENGKFVDVLEFGLIVED